MIRKTSQQFDQSWLFEGRIMFNLPASYQRKMNSKTDEPMTESPFKKNRVFA
jgi:hypothetical protein